MPPSANDREVGRIVVVFVVADADPTEAALQERHVGEGTP